MGLSLLTNVCVSHVASTDDFWIQRTEDEEAISETAQLVEIEVDMYPQLEEISVVVQLYAVNHPIIDIWSNLLSHVLFQQLNDLSMICIF